MKQYEIISYVELRFVWQRLTFTIILLLSISGCANQELVSKKLNLDVFNKRKMAHNTITFSFDIPPNYNYSSIKGHGIENRFTYKDASVIYISDEDVGNYNDSIIERDSFLLKTRRELRYSDRIIDLNGIDNNGLYWREIEKNGLNLGYYKVSSDVLNLYEKFINNARKKILLKTK